MRERSLFNLLKSISALCFVVFVLIIFSSIPRGKIFALAESDKYAQNHIFVFQGAEDEFSVSYTKSPLDGIESKPINNIIEKLSRNIATETSPLKIEFVLNFANEKVTIREQIIVRKDITFAGLLEFSNESPPLFTSYIDLQSGNLILDKLEVGADLTLVYVNPSGKLTVKNSSKINISAKKVRSQFSGAIYNVGNTEIESSEIRWNLTKIDGNDYAEYGIYSQSGEVKINNSIIEGVGGIYSDNCQVTILGNSVINTISSNPIGRGPALTILGGSVSVNSNSSLQIKIGVAESVFIDEALKERIDSIVIKDASLELAGKVLIDYAVIGESILESRRTTIKIGDKTIELPQNKINVRLSGSDNKINTEQESEIVANLAFNSDSGVLGGSTVEFEDGKSEVNLSELGNMIIPIVKLFHSCTYYNYKDTPLTDNTTIQYDTEITLLANDNIVVGKMLEEFDYRGIYLFAWKIGGNEFAPGTKIKVRDNLAIYPVLKIEKPKINVENISAILKKDAIISIKLELENYSNLLKYEYRCYKSTAIIPQFTVLNSQISDIYALSSVGDSGEYIIEVRATYSYIKHGKSENIESDAAKTITVNLSKETVEQDDPQSDTETQEKPQNNQQNIPPLKNSKTNIILLSTLIPLSNVLIVSFFVILLFVRKKKSK